MFHCLPEMVNTDEYISGLLPYKTAGLESWSREVLKLNSSSVLGLPIRVCDGTMYRPSMGIWIVRREQHATVLAVHDNVLLAAIVF